MSPWLHLGLLLALAEGTITARADAAAPHHRLPSIVETVRVRLRQIPLTLVPTNTAHPACSSLRRDDFLLYVDGRERGITALDQLLPTPAVQTETTVTMSRLRLVFVIDEYHLGFGDCSCPLAHRSRETAFQWAREAASALVPGDEVIVVSLGEPAVWSFSWLANPPELTAALDWADAHAPNVSQLASPSIRARAFSDEFLLVLAALAREPGQKDVVLLSRCIENLGEYPELLPQLAAAAQRAGAVVHTVDANGLRRTSEHLAEIASNLGGFSFARGLRVTALVQKLRTVADCRFLLSFEPAVDDDKGPPRAVRVELRQPGFELQTVVAVGGRQP